MAKGYALRDQPVFFNSEDVEEFAAKQHQHYMKDILDYNAPEFPVFKVPDYATVREWEFEKIHLFSTDFANLLEIEWNEADTADRTFSLLVDGGDRSATFEDDAIFDQDYTTDASVQFGQLVIGVGAFDKDVTIYSTAEAVIKLVCDDDDWGSVNFNDTTGEFLGGYTARGTNSPVYAGQIRWLAAVDGSGTHHFLTRTAGGSDIDRLIIQNNGEIDVKTGPLDLEENNITNVASFYVNEVYENTASNNINFHHDITLPRDKKVIFDSDDSSDTWIMMNSSSGKIEIYKDNVKRFEF
jgi:hypothetical protein